jgi:hypothetical protein
MPREVKIDGSLPLSGTESRCEQEQRAGYKLASIKFDTETDEGTVIEINRANFVEASVIDILDDLNFVAANDGDSLDTIKAANQGWTFILDTRLYVESHVKRVVVFGKQT